MKIILLENVKKLGNKGDLVNVSEGYARNFLFPRKLAETATEQAIEKLKKLQEDKKKKEQNETEQLRKIAFQINGKRITIRARGKKGKLFGSIGIKEIANELKKENFDIKEKWIIIEEAIKTVGEKEVILDFGKNIRSKIIVAIEEL